MTLQGCRIFYRDVFNTLLIYSATLQINRFDCSDRKNSLAAFRQECGCCDAGSWGKQVVSCGKDWPLGFLLNSKRHVLFFPFCILRTVFRYGERVLNTRLHSIASGVKC